MRTVLTVLVAVTLAHIGCSKGTPPPSDVVSDPPQSDDASTITRMGIGDYVIGTSTLTDILGTDTPEARRRFAKRGLNFQFDRGVTLTGITVTTDSFRLASGLVVGATSEAVRNEFGEPKSEKIENGKFTLDALVYDDFTFFLNGDTVSAIFVGRP